MPKFTCALASDRASARAGEADNAAATTTRNATRPFILDTRSYSDSDHVVATHLARWHLSRASGMPRQTVGNTGVFSWAVGGFTKSVYNRCQEVGRRVQQAAARQLESLSWSDADYPLPLAAIVDPPPVLWTRGSRDALRPPAIAIVGSRAASPYAVDVAERLAADLAGRGLAIVSGLARGVDS